LVIGNYLTNYHVNRDKKGERADAKTAANWTMAGICAHESAMNGGKRIEIPQAD